MTPRGWLVLIGFTLLAVPGTAQTSSAAGSPCDWPADQLSQRLSEDVSARLEARLKALPDRWDKILSPLVPISGRSSEEVLATASEEEQALVSEWITSLALSPPAERAALIKRELQARPLSEVDVWLPERFTDELRTTNVEEPTLYVEAWLEWVEALGRKDALLLAAGLGLERLALRAESRTLLETASRWAGLPSSIYATQGRASVLSKYAARLFAAGETDKALDIYRSARKLLEEIGDRRGQGYTFNGEADVLRRLGEHVKALDAYRRARKLFEQVGDQRGQGNAFNGEADILYLLGENKKALDAYRSALKLFGEVGDRRGQGNTLYGEAAALLLLGENDKALDIYRRSRKLFEEVGDRRGQGNTLYGEAEVLYLFDENEKALDAYRSARKLFEEVGSRLGEGHTLNGEGNVLLWLGENEKALDAYRSARKIYEEVGSRLGQGFMLNGEGDVLLRLGDNQEALAAYRSARKIFEPIGDRWGQGYTLNGEGNVLLRLGDNQKALAAYSSARKIFEESRAPVDLGNALLGEARLQSRQGNERDAQDLASQAVTAYRKAGSMHSERDAWLVMAEAEHSSGNLEPAVSAALEAVRLHAVCRSKRISETQRAQEDESIAAAYDILVPGLLTQARTEQALAAAEEARSHVLLDLLAAGFKRGKLGAAIDRRAERQRLISELSQVETESRQAADAGRRADLQRQRNRIDHELDWNQYQTLAAEQDTLLVAQPLDAAGIRAVARETGPILLYYAADKELIGFLVPSDGTDAFAVRIDVSRSRLTEAVQRYVHDEANPIYADRAAQQSRELWDLLFAPFAARLPSGGPLVIVPHGPLHELPFETLLDPTGTPLFERWAVSFAPSASTLARAHERHKEPQPKDSFLAFSSGRGLKVPEEEIGEVAQLFGNNEAAFRPTEARFENYEHLVPGARQLLISATGAWTPGDPRQTYIEILPTSDVHDSRLSVAEIAAMPLNAELVTLAACDTARGETQSSDERLDLTRAFLIAGAASVLSTRWKVPDEPATSRFLLDFYRAYRQSGPGGKWLRKDQALSEARRRSRERGDPAQVWAAWVLVGDAR